MPGEYRILAAKDKLVLASRYAGRIPVVRDYPRRAAVSSPSSSRAEALERVAQDELAPGRDLRG
jgi:hypothetical protein